MENDMEVPQKTTGMSQFVVLQVKLMLAIAASHMDIG